MNYKEENMYVVDNILFAEIRESNVHGSGLFSTSEIKKGTILGTLDGQVMNWDFYDSLFEKMKTEINNSENNIFMEWNALDLETLLVRPFRTKYSYINHSREANLIIAKYPLRVIVKEHIQANTELFLDYRKEPLRKEYVEKYGKNFL